MIYFILYIMYYRRLVIWYTNPKEFTPPGVPRIVPWHRPKAPIGSSSTTASDGSAIGKEFDIGKYSLGSGSRITIIKINFFW